MIENDLNESNKNILLKNKGFEIDNKTNFY